MMHGQIPVIQRITSFIQILETEMMPGLIRGIPTIMKRATTTKKAMTMGITETMTIDFS